MHTQVVLRNIASAASHLVHLLVFAFRLAINSCANPRTVRLRSDCLHLDPVILESAVAAKQLWYVVDTVHHDVQVAVIIKITNGAAASGNGLQDSWSSIH